MLGDQKIRFQTKIRNAKTFLYNTGPITSIDDPAWNRPQTYSVTRVANGKGVLVGRGLTVPPVNVGVRSTPNYASLAAQAIHRLPGDGGCSRGNGRRASSSTSAASSTSAGLRPFNMAAPHPVGSRGGGQRDPGPERALHRAAGAHQRPHPRRQAPQGRHRPGSGHRRVGRREPHEPSPSAATTPATRSRSGRTCRCPGSATRCSTRSSSR